MIRPITCICALLALGSGLYLYQSKYTVQLLDRQIEKIVRETDTLRDQTRLLHAEWMLLNDPERLRQFTDRYLSLKTVTPTQFTTLNDLAARLPAPRAPEPEPKPVYAAVRLPAAGTMAAGTDTPRPAEEPAPVIVAEEVLPIPPMHVPPPAILAQTPAPARPLPRPASVVADASAPRPPTGADQRPPTPTASPRPLETRAGEPAPPSRPAPGFADTQPPRSASTADARPPAPRPTASAPSPPSAQAQAQPNPGAQPIQLAARAAPPARVASSPVTAPPTSVAAPPIPASYGGGSMLGMAARGPGGASSAPLAAPLPLPRPVPAYSSQWSGGD